LLKNNEKKELLRMVTSKAQHACANLLPAAACQQRSFLLKSSRHFRRFLPGIGLQENHMRNKIECQFTLCKKGESVKEMIGFFIAPLQEY
jgi:hypothetical protein